LGWLRDADTSSYRSAGLLSVSCFLVGFEWARRITFLALTFI
jgi:hypothetical protein